LCVKLVSGVIDGCVERDQTDLPKKPIPPGTKRGSERQDLLETFYVPNHANLALTLARGNTSEQKSGQSRQWRGLGESVGNSKREETLW